MKTETYRGLDCYRNQPPIRACWRYTAYDKDCEVVAHADTLDELKADIDRYIEEQE